MRKLFLLSLLPALVLGAVVVPPAFSVAGKWTPEQMRALDPEWLRELGLEISGDDLWSAEGQGLLEAIVQVGGCSSGFVSPEGLLVTNHHCAFGLLQLHSTEEKNLIEEGFLATTREEELSGEGTRARIPHRFLDVTAAMESAVPEGATGYDRWEALEGKRKELVRDCESQEFRRCRVATYDDGVRHTLIEVLEFPDVRLVYAPPRSVGEYGGEVDNWMWPRHTGDFTLLRVYAHEGRDPAPYDASNRPYVPSKHLQVSTEGVNEGSFVLVVGYPGRTYRRYIAAEMAERAERYFPETSRLYRDWMDRMEAAGEADEGARIALASRLKSLANREKNARGQVAGLARGDVLAKTRARDQEVLAWAEERPEQQGAVEAYRALERLADQKLERWDADFLFAQARAGAVPLALALEIARWAVEKERPDEERDEDYQERNRAEARDDLERAQRRLHGATDVALTADWIRRLNALPESQRIAALGSFGEDEAAIEERVQALYGASKVLDLDARMSMFDESLEELTGRKDPLVDLALQLIEEVVIPAERRSRARLGDISIHRPIWRRAVEAHAGRPIDPDANSTLRVSLAHVEGCSPRDGLAYLPQTTLSGLVAKHTGAEPFDAPEALRRAAPMAPSSRFADAELGDLAVGFLATGDTTGGSSGSPVLDGQGRLVGVNFDRVWENVANDFGYNPDIARNVSVDVRYLLWLLETVEGEPAKGLLKELGVEAD